MPQAKHLYIPKASASWTLIMQSGVGLAVTVGQALSVFLTSELGLSNHDQGLIEALMLDGMPVDDLSIAIIEDGSRLALAAGLPGIAGLAMKKNSAVKALRGTITYRSFTEAKPRAGRMTLALYSLVLPALAPHFLKKGVFITSEQFKRYARFAPDNICLLEDRKLSAFELAQELSANKVQENFFMTALIEDINNESKLNKKVKPL